MSSQKPRFTILVSASRLEKGLLAVPQKLKNLFPSQKSQIKILFDDEDKAGVLTFHPYDPRVKETRIFGLGRWFSKRNVQAGDVVSITLEDPDKGVYRIALDRFIQEREEKKARQKLRSAPSDTVAEQQLSILARLTSKRPQQLAQEEVLRIAQESPCQPRPRVFRAATDRYEGVPPSIRVLLKELHEGKCQLCSFTFEKQNGEPYFEIHHLDPEVGHHPSNLLVLCPNCHAQFEHAKVTDFKWIDSWLVSVTINGKRSAIQQPLVHDSVRRILLSLRVLFVAAQIGRFLTGGVTS